MSLMQHQITDKQKWAIVETECGTEYIPIEQLGVILPDDCGTDTALELLRDYLEGTEVNAVETRKGYGARLTAPRHMDCTEWAVFDTVAGAKRYLEATYDDDDDNE